MNPIEAVLTVICKIKSNISTPFFDDKTFWSYLRDQSMLVVHAIVTFRTVSIHAHCIERIIARHWCRVNRKALLTDDMPNINLTINGDQWQGRQREPFTIWRRVANRVRLEKVQVQWSWRRCTKIYKKSNKNKVIVFKNIKQGKYSTMTLISIYLVGYLDGPSSRKKYISRSIAQMVTHYQWDMSADRWYDVL